MEIKQTWPTARWLRSAVGVAAAFALLAGLDGALVLLGLPAPVRTERLEQVHGMLMVFGFVGTVVALERAVAWGRRRGLLAPLALGLGGAAAAGPLPDAVGRGLMLLGAGGLVLIYLRLWARQPGDALLVQAEGSVAAVGATLLWLADVPVPRLLPWAVAFVTLTIAGERLELARVVPLSRRTTLTVTSLGAGLLATAPAALLWPETGAILFGVTLLSLVAWLLAHDVARRTVRSRGLTRYMGACLLAGYAWLAVAGGLWVLGGPATDGPRYDALVHAVFLGFTVSMVMAHAPVILPAVLRLRLPYHRLLWGPVVLLQASLLVRLGIGDLRPLAGAWQVGGLLGVLAVLAFGAVALRQVLGSAG